MRITRVARRWAALGALICGLWPAASAATTSLIVAPAVTWLAGLSDDQAAAYVADRLQRFGCVVGDRDRAEFSHDVLHAVAGEFAINLPPEDPGILDPVFGALVRELNELGRRAGRVLVETGEVAFLDDGTAFLTSCRVTG